MVLSFAEMDKCPLFYLFGGKLYTFELQAYLSLGNYWQSELKDPRDNFFQLVINQQEMASNKVIITLNHYMRCMQQELCSGAEIRLEGLNLCLFMTSWIT